MKPAKHAHRNAANRSEKLSTALYIPAQAPPSSPARSCSGTGSPRQDGNDPTDYPVSYTASDYVSYYAQRLCSACVLNGARGVLKGARAKLRALRRVAATAA